MSFRPYSNGAVLIRVGLELADCTSQFGPSLIHILVTRPNPPPYRKTGVAIPLSQGVSCGIADYRCYTLTSFRKNGRSQSKDRPYKGGGVSQKKHASEAYRTIGDVARNSIASRAIVGH